MTEQVPKPKRKAQQQLPTEQKIFLLALCALLPALALFGMLLAQPQPLGSLQLLAAGACLLWIVFIAYSVKNAFVYQIRTLNTLIEAIQAEDYSLRSRHLSESGDLAELYQQINSLTGQLQKSRQDEQELETLLQRIISQINVAIVVCDNLNKIVLVNHLAAKLLNQDEVDLLGSALDHTELAKVLPENNSHLIDFDFPGARGRWQISKQTYVQEGRQGSLIFITDLEQVLSEEEIKAWQSLIRVIAHEVNNSLTPITSLCQTMATLLSRDLTKASTSDLQQGLEVINERSKNLKGFISDYARIARMPDVHKVNFNLLDMLERLQAIYADSIVLLKPDIINVEIFGDSAQIEQVLINLIKNALEANAGNAQAVEIKISISVQSCEIMILDRGDGISNPANLFVPFYTTKDKGAGIGLVLSRRIVAAHNGEVSLANRVDGKGAIAILKLPLNPNSVRK